MSLISPPGPQSQAPQAPWACALLSSSSPWLFPRQNLNSLIIARLSLAGEGRHPIPQPRRNLRRESVKSQTLKLHFLTPFSFEGSLHSAGCDHTLPAVNERAISTASSSSSFFCSLSCPLSVPSRPPSSTEFPAYCLPLTHSVLRAPSSDKNLQTALAHPTGKSTTTAQHGYMARRKQQG